jgi:hypothetical protein
MKEESLQLIALMRAFSRDMRRAAALAATTRAAAPRWNSG